MSLKHNHCTTLKFAVKTRKIRDMKLFGIGKCRSREVELLVKFLSVRMSRRKDGVIRETLLQSSVYVLRSTRGWTHKRERYAQEEVPCQTQRHRHGKARIPLSTRSQQRLMVDFHCGLQRKHGTGNTLTSNFWPSERLSVVKPHLQPDKIRCSSQSPQYPLSELNGQGLIQGPCPHYRSSCVFTNWRFCDYRRGSNFLVA